MNIPTAIALIALTFQFATAATLLFIARAPGWRRVRYFALVALAAGVYNTIDVWAVLRNHPIGEITWVVQANLFVAAVHAAAWVAYTFSDEEGRWSSVPRLLRLGTIGSVTTIALLSLSGVVVDPNVAHRMRVPALGIDYAQPQLTPIGNVAAGLILAALTLVLVEHIRRMRRGVPGSTGLVIGFTLFALCSVEEVLVTAGVLNFMYLADIGYLCVVVPVTAQLVRRFSADAAQLSALSTQLATEVTQRTEERDAARDALVEQERLAALGRMAAGVGHEVNNPLQYLMSSLEELRHLVAAEPRSTGVPETLHRHLEQAFEGADRIRDVVQGLRTYASPGKGAQQTVDPRDVVTTAVRIASPQLRHLAIVRTTLDSVPLVRGEEGKLVQAVLNPLINAAQALGRDLDPRPGMVVVATGTTPSGDAEITITDNGPGFGADVLPRLGEPYVTTRAGEGGTGLGLFVTHGIVMAMGGEVSVSNHENGGAVVRLRLPASAGAVTREPMVPTAHAAPSAPLGAASPATRAPNTTADSRLRVLLVDDEASIREALARGLHRHGFDVVTAIDGFAALDLADDQQFDAIVSDLMMPNLSGMELAERLADRGAGVRDRFIAMTGGAVTPEAERFVERADVTVVEKPVELSRLAATIRTVVQRSAARET